MKNYLVSYDLNNQGKNYDGLINRLKQLGAVKILYSEWVLRSAATAADLRDDLMRFTDGDDLLLVCGLTGEAAWTKLMVSHDIFKRSLAA